MKKLNSEQEKAVFHSGGVSLKAGAGSGKTTVLVAHIIYLIEVKLSEIKNLNSMEQEIAIKNLLQNKVLMTFTRKAAGEMKIRLFEQIEIRKNDQQWALVLKNIDYLLITTIDGFCSRLIKKGFIPGINSNFEIGNPIQLKEKFNHLVETWLLQKNASTTNDLILKNIFHNKESLKNTIFQIFSDPSKRLLWADFDQEKYKITNGYEALVSWLDILGYSELKKQKISIDKNDAEKKWALTINYFQNNHFTNFNELILFFNKLKDISSGARKPSGDEIAADHLAKIMGLRDEVKKHLKSIETYFTNFETVIVPYTKILFELFYFIENEYHKIPIISYSDLEYYTYKGLLNKKIQDEVYSNYHYLIVDEFQDTSNLQYKILKLIIKDDFSRIFVVGDVKQAIYGFRGGEVSVFQDIQKKVSHDLSLNMNYRSHEQIILYNNEFYKELFRFAEDFVTPDPLCPIYEPQHSQKPAETPINRVQKLKIEIKKPVDEVDFDYFEAKAILEKIKIILPDLKNKEDIAILYRKLNPSKILRDLFIDSKIGFTSQVKIEIQEDPIIGLFNLAILFDLNSTRTTVSKSFYELVHFYLQHLGINQNLDIASGFDQFTKNIKFWGLFESYIMLLNNFNIITSRYEENLNLIKSLIELYGEDSDVIYENLNKNHDSKISLEFYFGNHPSRIKMMTAHASKGLQFDHVFVASLYTSDRGQNNTSSIGDDIGSFSFKLSWEDKESLKTPQYIFEKSFKELKEYSESKRLLYVATTRAISHLYWIDLICHSEKEYGGQWFKMFKQFGHQHIQEQELQYDDHQYESIINKLNHPIPLFQIDTLGSTISEAAQGYFISDLSVTRLAQGVSCPRKFYFKNILKLESPKNIVFENDEPELEVSSMKRGSELHAFLDLLSKHNWVIPLKHKISKEDLIKVHWVIEQLKPKIFNSQFYSEEELKFKIHHFTINGIADLGIIGTDSFEIWDYKTGRMSHDSLENYWFQLHAYAYAYYQLSRVPKDKPIKLVLCFLDEFKLIEKTVNFEQANQLIIQVWEKIKNPEQTNQDHCSKCDFHQVCNL